MLNEEFESRLAQLIEDCTVQRESKKPVHFYSAFIDGKLYMSCKHKTVWTRKNDVVNSLKNNSDLFLFLRKSYRQKLIEANPEWFEHVPYSLQIKTKTKYLHVVEELINVFIDDWWDKHVEIKEVAQ